MLAAIENDLTDVQFDSGFKATLYLYVTVGELLGPALSRTIMSLRSYDAADAGCIDRLAYARNMISVNEEAAWQIIDTFRAAHGLRVVKSHRFPESGILIARERLTGSKWSSGRSPASDQR